MIPLLAFTLIAGVSNAQTTDKKPVKVAAPKTEMTKKAAEHKTAVSAVTPSTNGKKATAATTHKIIKRKHHKKAKAAQKTATK